MKTITVPKSVATVLGYTNKSSIRSSMTANHRNSGPISEEDVKKTKKYTQYIDQGHIVRPAGPLTVAASLRPGIYTLDSDIQGLFLEPHFLKTDALLKFKDKRQTTVLSEISNFWNLKDKYDSMGYIHKRGILLYGAPGTGKSCILKLVMNEVIKEGDVILIAKRPSLLVNALGCIRQVEPSRRILAVLEDVDEMCKYSEGDLLGLFDGDSQQDGVLFLGTTNYLDKLPPRMVRTGRFDRRIEIGTPGLNGRIAYLTSKLSNKVNSMEIKRLGKKTDGLNFSQLKELMVSVYCLGYDLDKSLSRITSGHEGLEISPKRDKLLTAELKAFARG